MLFKTYSRELRAPDALEDPNFYININLGASFLVVQKNTGNRGGKVLLSVGQQISTQFQIKLSTGRVLV